MKVLIANCHRSIVGGAERYLQAVIPELLKRNHRIAILHTFKHDPQKETIDPADAGLPCWHLQDNDPAQVREQIHRWGPDVVFGHGLEPVEFERWLCESFPFIAFLHNYSHTCPTGRKCHLTPRIQACNRTAGPMCLLLHYPLRCGGLHPKRSWDDYRRQAQRQRMLPLYRSVLVASQHMYEETLAHADIGPCLRLVNIPLTGIEPLSSPPPPRTPAGKLVITGRLTDVKGTDYVLRALPLASRMLGKELQLVVAGSGPELHKLKTLATRIGAQVQFPGWVDLTGVRRAIQDSDLLVIPSLWPEPFGLVGIEAGCLATPSVGFAMGGIRDWLIPGQTGELAPGNPPTAEGLATTIYSALRDVEHYNRLRMGAWRYSLRRSISAHADELDEVFASADRINSPAL